MKQDNLFIGKEAREALMRGVKKASEAVAMTLGTSGSNSLIECIERPNHYSTNDGATILGSIKFEDPIEEMGRQVLYEAVSRANKSSGDGSSTTCVLTSAILEEGMKHLDEASPMEIKRSLEACIPLIEASVNSQKKEIDVNSVAQVATISAEDAGIGNMIQEIYQKIGKDGIIHWDISKTAEDSYTIGTGLTIQGATCAAPYMYENGNEVRLTNPYILLARKKITTALDFESLFPALFQQEIKEIVIFCDDIDIQVIADLYKTQRIRGFRSIVVKMPVLWKDEWWEDLAKASGGTLIDVASGIKVNEATIEHLGKVEHMTISKEATYIDGIQDLTKHILALKVDGSEQSLLRASRLNTQTARYFVGAHSESALAYRRLKLEDALNAASCALENGVVAGGGVALMVASKQLPEKEIGQKILKNALKSPFHTIVKNCGENPEEIEKEAEEYIYLDFYGYDSKERKIKSMFNAGIIDPTDVCLNAIRSAIGVAASILTCGSVVVLPTKEETKVPFQ